MAQESGVEGQGNGGLSFNLLLGERGLAERVPHTSPSTSPISEPSDPSYAFSSQDTVSST